MASTRSSSRFVARPSGHLLIKGVQTMCDESDLLSESSIMFHDQAVGGDAERVRVNVGSAR